MKLDPGEKLVIGGEREPIAGLVFALSEVRFSDPVVEKSFLSVIAQGEHDGKICGFAFDMLLKDWEREEQDGFSYFRGDIRLRSLPTATENLVSTIEDFFQIETAGSGILEKLFCECVGINSDPIQIKDTEFVGRIFFGDGDPPKSEVSLFLTVDIPRRIAWLSEKDTAYREGLVSWMRGKFQ